MRVNFYKTIFILVIGLCINSYVDAQTLTKYAKQKQQEIVERQRIEKQKYEEACQKGTLSAFQEYAKLYPNGKYITEINNRIEDFSLWSSAKSNNTVSGYTQYLQQSKYKTFDKEAQSAITELKSEERWNVIKPSGNIDDIREFINQYPNSSCKDEAQKRICELEGVEYFKNGNLLDALKKFDEAGGRYLISSTNHSIYDKCKEFQDYKNISSETDCETFLKKYPQSVYYNEVSNKVALAKASSMSIFSTEYTFNDVLSYAKDDVTRNEVKRYIEIKKDSYRKYERNERKNRIMANGGYVQFGFELIDFGLNTFVSDRYLNILYYNVGASVKVGNYKAPIQFEVGIKPGVFAYDYYDSDDSGGEFADATYKFHMPVYAKLKVNICSVGSSCKLYAAGLATYNAIKVKDIENDFSVGGGLGFAWKRWDWLTLYYKQDVSDKYNFGNKFLGTSLVYYL
jgi:outer membrane protein assembly factor BamD (BamD/ComL family)